MQLDGRNKLIEARSFESHGRRVCVGDKAVEGKQQNLQVCMTWHVKLAAATHHFLALHSRTMNATHPIDTPVAHFCTLFADRFRFTTGDVPAQDIKCWLRHLPLRDHCAPRRFAKVHIEHLIASVETQVHDIALDAAATRKGKVLDRVRRAYAANRRAMPQKLVQDIEALPIGDTLPIDAFVLLTYSFELHEDFANANPTKSCPFQIYKEFNRMCRQYGQCAGPSPALAAEWALFLPFTLHLDRAIRALPRVPTVLYRGVQRGTETHRFPVGATGSFGGCLSASSDRHRGAAFVSKDSQLHADNGSFFMILSDQARPMYHLSVFPEEMEHVHPLDHELEVCTVVPVSLLQLLSLKISVITFKSVGSSLSLELCLQALEGLRFLYDGFLRAYIPPVAKDDPHAPTAAPVEALLAEFLASPRRVLLVAAEAGVGKTSCALRLARRVRHAGYVWLFVSLAAVPDVFARGALVRHVRAMLGCDGGDAVGEELRQQRMVWILDSLDEVPAHPTASDWWELNGLDDWRVKLVVTCRVGHAQSYGRCLGESPRVVYLQGFGPAQVREYVDRRLLLWLARDGHRQWDPPRGRQGPGPPPSRAHPFHAAAAGAAGAVAAALLERWRDRMLGVLEASRIQRSYSSPFKLNMAVELFVAGALPGVHREADLYGRWLRQQLPSPHAAPAEAPPGDPWRWVAGLAWDLHRRGVTHDRVGARGQCRWFRQCPLRINDYHPDTVFSFQHKSLQEYLVALHLYLTLHDDAAGAVLSHIDLTHDFPVLRFFGDICAAAGDGPGGGPGARAVCQRLLDHVRASVDDANGAGDRRGANGLSLLNAAQYSFAALDLRGIRAPHAALQCGNFFNADLRGAVLAGADLRGAVLDFADLRGADLTGAALSELRATLIGHRLPVLSVAVSPDGRTIVSGSEDGAVNIWDRASGALVRTRQGQRPVHSVTVSGAGWVAATGAAQGVGLWQVCDGALLATLPHPARVRSVAAEPCGALLAVGCDDGAVHVWDPAERVRLCTLRGHSNAVTGVAVCPDAGLVVSGSEDRTVRTWAVALGAALRTLRGHTAAVWGVACARGGAVAVSGAEDRTVRVWDPTTGAALHTLEGHKGPVLSVAVAPDARIIVSGSDDGTTCLWSAATGERLRTLEAHTFAVAGVAATPDGRAIVSACGDRTVRVWDAGPGELLRESGGHTDAVWGVAVAPAGRTFASCSSDGTVRVWDAATLEPLHALEGHTRRVLAVAASPCGTQLVSGSADRTVRLWSAADGALLRTADVTVKVTAVAVYPDGGRLAVAGDPGRGAPPAVLLLDAAALRPLQALEGHRATVTSVAVSQDGAHLVSGALDATVRVWDGCSGEALAVLHGHTRPVLAVAVGRRGGALVASASGDRTVRLWDTAASAGALRHTLRGHLDGVESVVLSPDECIVVSGSRDMTVRVWHASSGRLLHCLTGHTNTVSSVAVTPDGRTVVSGSYDRTLRTWGLPRDGRCGVLREASRRLLRVFAKGARVSPQTKLSDCSRDLLKDLGAVSSEN